MTDVRELSVDEADRVAGGNPLALGAAILFIGELIGLGASGALQDHTVSNVNNLIRTIYNF